MTTKPQLNYTHGRELLTFCDRAADGTAPRRDLVTWVRGKMEDLRRNQDSLWGITASMAACYGFLERLEELLAHNAPASAFAEIRQEIAACTRRQIHVLFLTQEVSCWPSLESVFRAARENADYVATLVYTPFFHENFSQQTDYYDAYHAMGIPAVRHNEYDLRADSPDVVFIIKPYAQIPERYHTDQLEKVIPRLVYIPYGMEITTDLILYGFQFYAHYRAWRHCAYGPIVKEYGTRYGYRAGENIAVWGHPKADHFRDPEANRAHIPPEWVARIKGRKTILWTPHHLIDLSQTGTGTWLIWGERILEMAEKRTDLFFILRPHPMMMGALVNSGTMTQAQADRLRQRIDQAENILWDTNSSYHAAFDAADAIITDGTTFCVEFLYTKKPILLTPRNMEGFYLYREMMDSYYIVREAADIRGFMDMVARGEDPLEEKRLAMFRRHFFVPEHCTVGEHIMRQVKIDLDKECLEQITMNQTLTPAPAAENRPDPAKFPLFSILVLCYKNMDLLFGMLDTIFRQDYPRIQLVVSDDGSEDFDVARVERYIELNKGHNIESYTVRTNQTNMRTVRHIHKAMDYVTGDYFVFTAADDRFHGTDALSRYVELFLKNPEALWLVARCNMTSADYATTLYVTPTATDEPYFLEGDARRLFSRWSRRGMAIPCCMAFRRDALDRVGGFDLDYLFLEDWPLVLKLLRNGHAPIFCQQITAIHSTGGVSNSNQRYGKEIRRLFYEDKYTIFRKEVEPYLDMLTPEDRKAYKLYLKEIMERHYFFFIDWEGAPLGTRLRLCLQKPIRLWWVFERRYMQFQERIPRKKLLILSQGLLLLSMLFLNDQGNAWTDLLFRCLGWVDLALGLGLLTGILISFPLNRHFKKKARFRNELVN